MKPNSLRFRLTLSHVLPMLVIIPIVGVALVYTLETKVLLGNLSEELRGQALLVAEIANDYAPMWEDRVLAEAFVARTSPHLTAHVMLLTAGGSLLASSDPADGGRVGRPYEFFDREQVSDGVASVNTSYSRQLHAEVAQVLVPVMSAEQQMMGVVRVSRRLDTVRDWFLRLRYAIAEVLAAGLVVGAVTGGVLAVNMERPLRQVTGAIQQLSNGRQSGPLPEQGAAEIRLLLRAVNTLIERLQAMEHTRRQLLANLVHELGRPLGALYSAIEALQVGADRDPDLRGRLLDGMRKEIERLQRLLSDLSHLHDQIVGTLDLRMSTINLGTWLPQVLAPWEEAAHHRNLRWNVTIPECPPALQGDPDRLAQVLGNLLSNAIKYTPPEGAVSVMAGTEAEAVWIQVQDTGPGLSAEEQTRLFEPFFRGRASGRFPEGMGLGLSIARELVVAHGGELTVQSTPGRGSCFTVWLPLQPAEDPFH